MDCMNFLHGAFHFHMADLTAPGWVLFCNSISGPKLQEPDTEKLGQQPAIGFEWGNPSVKIPYSPPSLYFTYWRGWIEYDNAVSLTLLTPVLHKTTGYQIGPIFKNICEYLQ